MISSILRGKKGCLLTVYATITHWTSAEAIELRARCARQPRESRDADTSAVGAGFRATARGRAIREATQLNPTHRPNKPNFGCNVTAVTWPLGYLFLGVKSTPSFPRV